MIHHKEIFSDIFQFTNYLCTVPAQLLSHSILNFSYYDFLFLVSLIRFFQICCFLYQSHLSTTFLKFCFSPPWTNKYSDFEICLTILVNIKDSLGLFMSWQIRGVLFPSFKSSSVFISSSHCGALGGTDRQIWTVSLDAAPWRLGRRERGRENSFWSRNSVTGSATHKETGLNYFEGQLNSGEPAQSGGIAAPFSHPRGRRTSNWVTGRAGRWWLETPSLPLGAGGLWWAMHRPEWPPGSSRASVTPDTQATQSEANLRMAVDTQSIIFWALARNT